MHVEVLEMCDLAAIADAVSDEETHAKLDQVKQIFEFSQDSPADPLGASRIPRSWMQPAESPWPRRNSFASSTWMR